MLSMPEMGVSVGTPQAALISSGSLSLPIAGLTS